MRKGVDTAWHATNTNPGIAKKLDADRRDGAVMPTAALGLPGGLCQRPPACRSASIAARRDAWASIESLYVT